MSTAIERRRWRKARREGKRRADHALTQRIRRPLGWRFWLAISAAAIAAAAFLFACSVPQ